MCATRKRAPVLRHHEDTFFVILVFLMFCWFFFCSQVYNEEKRWKTKGPTYTALWGHFFATPRCNPQMTGRRGWHANSSPGFYVCDICQVWSFSLFVTSGFKTLQNLDLTIFSGIWLNAFKSYFLICCCSVYGSLVSWACHKSFFIFWGVLEVWFRYHNLSLLLPANGPFLSPLVQLWLHTYHPLPCKMALVENLSEKDMNLPCKMGWVYLLLKGTSIWEPWFATGERKSRPVSDIELWSHKKALIWWWSKKKVERWVIWWGWCAGKWNWVCKLLKFKAKKIKDF